MTVLGRPVIAALVAIALAATGALAEEMPDGYRDSHYRAPTPLHVPGASTVDTEQVVDLMRTGAALLDVSPAVRAADGFDRWLVGAPHMSIPGSLWLPNVGLGAIDGATKRAFSDALEGLRADNPRRPVVIFCRADCWMSWNAAKRAASWGHGNLHWYREGIDGWQATHRPLTAITPVSPYGTERQ